MVYKWCQENGQVHVALGLTVGVDISISSWPLLLHFIFYFFKKEGRRKKEKMVQDTTTSN